MYGSYGAVPPPGAPYSDPGMYGSDPVSLLRAIIESSYLLTRLQYAHQPGYGAGALVPMGHRFPTPGRKARFCG
jgi:hypothetical protein